ncbi:MAG: alanine racemase [Gammaproteobacteria bacterium]
MRPAAYAQLNLDALTHNLAVVRRHAPAAKVMAVIKANAYGHGMLRVAKRLPDADAFAVARVDEGILLRKAGIEQPIAVLEGFTCAEELDELVRYRLDTLVHSRSQLSIFEQFSGTETIKVWLKIDTGMNRLGFAPAEASEAYRRLAASRCVERIGLMTHLANADDKNDTLTLQQIRLFEQTVASLQGPRSIANSAGILGWRDALADWVRPGIMLYGISPFPGIGGIQLDLVPVMSLHSRLIAVKPVNEGDKVGYGGTWICRKRTALGVVAIGYGDGYPRHARTGTPVLVNGLRVPLVGRVSMDMITVDLASQPDARAGDPVTLWGEGLAVEEIAACADTIPYTLVCGITQRFKIV